jgi:hypothetical protein
MVDGTTTDRTVTVKVPPLAKGYGDKIPETYSGGEKDDNWGNGFRGAGWKGSNFVDIGSINTSITLEIAYGP